MRWLTRGRSVGVAGAVDPGGPQHGLLGVGGLGRGLAEVYGPVAGPRATELGPQDVVYAELKRMCLRQRDGRWTLAADAQHLVVSVVVPAAVASVARRASRVRVRRRRRPQAAHLHLGQVATELRRTRDHRSTVYTSEQQQSIFVKSFYSLSTLQEISEVDDEINVQVLF